MRKTKAITFSRIAAKVRNRPMPSIRADGSIGTHPSVPCPPLPEHAVMDAVKDWLERHGCVVDRLSNGAGYLNGREDFGQYGIIGGGDLVGMLPDGRHLELEVKKGVGGILGKNQVKRRKRVRRGGGVYEVIHGVPELEHKILPLLR